MALASEDIWQKFDLSCAERLDLSKMDMMETSPVDHTLDDADLFLTDLVGRSVINTTIVGGMPPSSPAAAGGKPVTATSAAAAPASRLSADTEVVPDIIDILSDSATFDMDINMDDGGIDMDFDNFLDDILRLEDPLRQDCMWSAAESSASSSSSSSPTSPTSSSSSRLDSLLPLTNVSLDVVASKDMSCFDTPLSSETSDLDETSSDLEAEVEAGLCARLQPSSPTSSSSSSQDFTFADHSYVASASLSRHSSASATPTFTDSSEEEDKPVSPPPTTFKLPSSFPSSTARRNVCLVKTKPCSTSSSHTKPSQAKFKFHMKFKQGPATTSSSRSLLRSQRSSAIKRPGAVSKAPLIPYSSKTIQVHSILYIHKNSVIINILKYIFKSYIYKILKKLINNTK